MHPVAAGGLGVADRAELVEHLVCHVGHLADRVVRRLRAGVEVDPPLVGLLDVAAAAVPRVELDRGHLHGPDDAGELGDAQLVGVQADGPVERLRVSGFVRENREILGETSEVWKIVKKMLPFVGTAFFFWMSAGLILTSASSAKAENALKA